MKKIIFIIFIMSVPSLVWANFIDLDGHLNIVWSPPTYGNQLDHYFWTYTINGVADSITGTSPANDMVESSVVLDDPGDWAVFGIKAISTQNDTSIVAVSDTVFFKLSLDVNDEDIDNSNLVPQDFSIQVFPNPVYNHNFSLKWNVNQPGKYQIEIYNILGQKVKTILNERVPIGESQRYIDEPLATGIYFAIIRNGDKHRMVKFTIIR
ncbi:MAG: T9SS type A sorting domain-containing protein [FCB group bacterium]|nr:T9SS type A sorting domain-containing protein [FCB group bacterium]